MYIANSPTNLTDFIQLKEEINYFSRPDKETDWNKVVKLAERLLTANGTDLQTLVYLTVGRYRLYRDFNQLSQDLEQIAIALVSYWDGLWPQDKTARINMLNWLNRQISEPIRFVFNEEVGIQAKCRVINSLKLIVEQINTVGGGEHCHLNYLLITLDEQFTKSVRNLTACLPEHIQDKEEAIGQSSVSPLTIPDSETPNHKKFTEKTSAPSTPLFLIVDPKRFGFLSLLLAFSIGILFSGGIGYFLLQKTQQQFTQALSSPTDFIERQMQWVEKKGESETKKELTDKLNHYVLLAQPLVKPNLLKQQLIKLQQDLLQAEKNKQGLTISYLKTSLYEMEKIANAQDGLYEQLYQYSQSSDSRLKQKIDDEFLSLLAYYYHLQQTKNPPSASAEK